jgi:hypothetical protein
MQAAGHCERLGLASLFQSLSRPLAAAALQELEYAFRKIEEFVV